MSIPCGHKKNTETVAQYRKRCGPRPLGMIGKMSEGDDKLELIKLYNKAMKMIPGSANQKKIKKQISVLRKKLKMDEAPRKPRKKGQHRNSPNHSDLYTDENPKGTIHGLKFATQKDAKASVNKIKSSGKSHAHKIQAAIAMEQRAKAAGKVSAAGEYRKFINMMKKKTKAKNENITIPIKVGDTVLGGKFKNKRIVVKSIGKNDKGDITINGRPLLKFRLVKEGVEVEFPKDMPQDENVNTFFYDDMKKYIYKNRGKINKVMKHLPDNKKYDFLEKLYVKLFKGPTYRMAEKDIKGKGKELHQMLVKDKYIKEVYYDNLGNKCPGPVTLDGRCLHGRNTYQKEGVGMNRTLHKDVGPHDDELNEVGIFKISQFTKGIIPQGRLDTHTPQKKKEAIKLIKNFHSMLNAFWRENDIPFRARLR